MIGFEFMWVRSLFVCFMTLALGCASGVTSRDGTAISQGDLLEAAPLGVGQDPPGLVTNDEVLALSPEMREFLKENVHRKATIGVMG